MMNESQLPQHVGLILDGNRRWAREHGVPLLQGHRKGSETLKRIPDPAARHARLCELNVIEQAVNVCQTTVVQDAWDRGQALSVHGWIYGLADGLVSDLGLDIAERARIASSATAALAALGVDAA